MKKIFSLVVLFAILLVPTAALAGETKLVNIYIAEDEVVSGNYFRAAQVIEIDGSVEGDVIAAAQTIIINGSVSGDVIAAADTIRIGGTVAGNIRLAGNTIEVSGAVAKNATLFGNTVSVTSDGSVGWSVQAFAATFSMRGNVNGNVDYYGATAGVRGTIGGYASFTLGDESVLELDAPTTIGGDLTYHSTLEASIEEGVVVTGATERLEPTAWTGFSVNFASFTWALRLGSFVAAVIIGLLMFLFLPKTSRRIVEYMKEKPAQSFGWGIVAFIVVPIAFSIVFFTLVGIPLSFIAIALYAIALYFTKLYAGLFIGTFLFQKLRKNKETAIAWTFLLGFVLFTLLTWIPYIGWLVGFVGMIWALGALIKVKWAILREIER